MGAACGTRCCLRLLAATRERLQATRVHDFFRFNSTAIRLTRVLFSHLLANYYVMLLYSAQLGTSLSVQQIALDSAFSHQERKKIKRRASLLKTAAEPNMVESAFIDESSAARGNWLHRGIRQTGFARTAASYFAFAFFSPSLTPPSDPSSLPHT